MRVQLCARSNADVDAGRWRAVLGEDACTTGASTFARFGHLLPDGTSARLSHHAARAADVWAGGDVLFADLTYVPSASRLIDLALAPPLHDLEIRFGTGRPTTRPSVELREVVVVIGPSGFTLQLPHDGRTLVARPRHQLDIRHAPHPVRFVAEVSTRFVGRPPGLDLSHLDHFVRMPAFTRGRVVLLPAAWRPTYSSELTPSRVAFWRDRLALPRWVHAVTERERLLLDLDSDVALDELRGMGRTVRRLEDATDLMAQPWLVDSGGRRFASELCVPLVAEGGPRRASTRTCRAETSAGQGNVLHPPGSPWLALRLDAPSEWFQDVVGSIVPALLHDLGLEGHRWFFVTSGGLRPHVRLRVELGETPPAAVLGAACEVLHDHVVDGALRDFAVESFRPEINR